MGIAARAKKSWDELKRGRPGRRFQQRFERKHRGGKVATVLLGTGLVLVGLALMVIPGPGIPFVVIGAGLLAETSLLGARFLDGCELRIRALLGWGNRVWKSASAAGRAAIVGGAVALAGAGAYGAWWVAFGR